MLDELFSDRVDELSGRFTIVDNFHMSERLL